MEEIFVTKLRINKVRHLENLEIPLSDTERKHLILTGKNGSGKTSVLEGIITFIKNIQSETNIDSALQNENTFNDFLNTIANAKKELADKINQKPQEVRRIKDIVIEDMQLDDTIDSVAPVQIISNLNGKIGIKYNFFEAMRFQEFFIIKYFKAKRDFQPVESLGPQKIESKSGILEDVNQNFVRLLVNLRFDLLDLKDRGNFNEAKKIEEWMERFEGILKKIFEDQNLSLIFDRSNFNFNIFSKHKSPFNLNQLSDGYASFISIVSELIMRMGVKNTEFKNVYDLQGIVLIDEIETHLHIDLQKKILPFLTTFFPKIQFIVTTHSPFVLSSIDNAVIYDLEKQERVEDLSAYSYTNIVKGYFEADEYSQEVKEKIREYEKLVEKSKHDTGLLTLEEKEKYYDLKRYFEQLPKTLSPELQLKIQQLELSRLAQ